MLKAYTNTKKNTSVNLYLRTYDVKNKIEDNEPHVMLISQL